MFEDPLDALRPGVADSDGSIGILQQIADRAPYNIAAAEDNGILAFQVDTRLLKEDHDTLRGAGNEKWVAALLGELANVGGAKSVDILLVGNGGGDGVLIDVLGQG